jgi:(+)-pinoresinol hydroxylase
MSALRLPTTIAVIGLASLLGTAVASADRASSAQSAWAPLPERAGSTPADPRQRRGQAVFHERCEACHGEIPGEIFGPVFLPPMPGTQALQARYRGTKPAALEQRTDLTREFVTVVVRRGLGAMPFFRPTELSDDDLDALVAYLTRAHR